MGRGRGEAQGGLRKNPALHSQLVALIIMVKKNTHTIIKNAKNFTYQQRDKHNGSRTNMSVKLSMVLITLATIIYW